MASGQENLPGRCPDTEFVAIGVGELCPFAPGFSAQLLGNSDSTSFERRTGFFTAQIRRFCMSQSSLPPMRIILFSNQPPPLVNALVESLGAMGQQVLLVVTTPG